MAQIIAPQCMNTPEGRCLWLTDTDMYTGWDFTVDFSTNLVSKLLRFMSFFLGKGRSIIAWVEMRWSKSGKLYLFV